MILTIAFLFASLFLGIMVSRHISALDGLHKKLAFACSFGLALGVWVCFLLSWAFGILGRESIIASILLLLAASLALHSKAKGIKAKANAERRTKQPHEIQERFYAFVSKNAGILAVLLPLALLLVLNVRLIAVPTENGGMDFGGNIWGDYPLHLGMIYSFSERPNYPPTYPQFLGVPLRYPFMIEFFSAIMVSDGFSLKAALIIPHILLYFGLLSFAFFLASKALKSKAAGAFFLLLFFLNGNSGIINAVSDTLHSGNAWDYLMHLPRAYSHISEGNLEFMNLLFSVFLPQRTAIFGFAVFALIMYLLYDRKLTEKWRMAACGIALGLLPFIHSASFIAAGAVAAWLFARDVYSAKQAKRKEIAGQWLWFILPAAVLSIPQIIFVSQGLDKSQFLSYRFGWMLEKAPSLLEFAKFWLKNAWLPLLLGIYGFYKAPKELKILAVPFALFFLVPNFFQLAPWDWDSIKILVFAFFGLCLFAAIPLAELWNSHKNKLQALALLLALASIASGVLTLMWWWGDQPQLYSQRDFEIADWIKSNTPENAVWLTSNDQNHVVPSLTGRQTVLGLKWWAYSHGLEAWKIPVEEKVNEFFPTANCSIAKEFNASYVFIGPQEIGIENADPQKFRNSPFYEKVFDRTMQGRRTEIYRVNC